MMTLGNVTRPVMPLIVRHATTFLSLLFFSLFLFYPETTPAAEISSTTQLSFGVIIADPSGEQVEIDASSGPAVPQKITAGVSHISGGSSGTIRILSTTAGQPIQIDYLTPDITLTANGDTMALDGIISRSIATSVTVVGYVNIYVGGLLHIKPGQSAGAYSGSIQIMVTYQ